MKNKPKLKILNHKDISLEDSYFKFRQLINNIEEKTISLEYHNEDLFTLFMLSNKSKNNLSLECYNNIFKRYGLPGNTSLESLNSNKDSVLSFIYKNSDEYYNEYDKIFIASSEYLNAGIEHIDNGLKRLKKIDTDKYVYMSDLETIDLFKQTCLNFDIDYDFNFYNLKETGDQLLELYNKRDDVRTEIIYEMYELSDSIKNNVSYNDDLILNKKKKLLKNIIGVNSNGLPTVNGVYISTGFMSRKMYVGLNNGFEINYLLCSKLKNFYLSINKDINIKNKDNILSEYNDSVHKVIGSEFLYGFKNSMTISDIELSLRYLKDFISVIKTNSIYRNIINYKRDITNILNSISDDLKTSPLMKNKDIYSVVTNTSFGALLGGGLGNIITPDNSGIKPSLIFSLMGGLLGAFLSVNAGDNNTVKNMNQLRFLSELDFLYMYVFNISLLSRCIEYINPSIKLINLHLDQLEKT